MHDTFCQRVSVMLDVITTLQGANLTEAWSSPIHQCTDSAKGFGQIQTLPGQQITLQPGAAQKILHALQSATQASLLLFSPTLNPILLQSVKKRLTFHCSCRHQRDAHMTRSYHKFANYNAMTGQTTRQYPVIYSIVSHS